MSENSGSKVSVSNRLIVIRLFTLATLVPLFYLIVLSWDPLGADTPTMRYFQGLTYRTLAYLQDHGLDVYPEAAQKNITVVLATDKAINSLGHAWPPPYYFHADVLRDIGRYQPKAIFIDFLFSGERAGEGIEQLADEICEMKKNGIPIFLASDDFHSKDGGVIAKLTKCGIVVDANKPRSEGAEDGVDGYYRLVSKYDWGRGISPALAMYAVDRKSWPLSEQELQSWNLDMEIFWSGQPPKNSLTWMPDCQKKPQYMERLFGKSTCYYAQTLFLDQLFTEEKDFPYKRELLKGKLIFYGANFTGAGDVSLTPLHENMPGVYLHAMALDNLMSYGPYYKKTEGNGCAVARSIAFMMILLFLWLLISSETENSSVRIFAGVSLSILLIPAVFELGNEIRTWSNMALLVYIMVVLLWTYIVFREIRHSTPSLFQNHKSLFDNAVFLLLALMIAIGYAIQEQAVFDLSPQNWLETSFFVISIGLFSKILGGVEKFCEYMERFYEWILRLVSKLKIIRG